MNNYDPTRILVIDASKKVVRNHYLFPPDLLGIGHIAQVITILSGGDHKRARKMKRNGLDVIASTMTGDMVIGFMYKENTPRGFENDLIDNGLMHGNAVVVGGFDDELNTFLPCTMDPEDMVINWVSDEVVEMHRRCLN